MTRSSGRQSVLALALAVAAGGWLMAGLSEIRGESPDRSGSDTGVAAEAPSEGWIWSGSEQAQPTYQWADTQESSLEQPAPRTNQEYSWDSSLGIEHSKRSGEQL